MSDEIREAFERRARNMGYNLSKSNGGYIEPQTLELFLGYRMCNEDRDEEVRDLQEQIGYLKSDIINLKGETNVG